MQHCLFLAGVCLSVCLYARLFVWRFAAQFILTKDCVSVTFRGVVLSAHFQLPLDVVFVGHLGWAGTLFYFLFPLKLFYLLQSRAEHTAARTEPQTTGFITAIFLERIFRMLSFFLAVSYLS